MGLGVTGRAGRAPSPARRPARKPVQGVVRDAYVRFGETTAGVRLQPSFIVIGAQRCGTTSLFRALREHPQVFRAPFHKGVNYFDLNYHRGMRWYQGHFPMASLARRKAARHGEPAAFEASGYYLYHPFALERLASDLPETKLVAMLREPADRAFSAYKHEYARGFEPEDDFERALDLEEKRLAGEVDRMREDIRYQSVSHRHHSYLHRGHYADQLERAFSFFPQEQVFVMYSEAYFSQPAREYRRLLDFLSLRPHAPEIKQVNARPSQPMPGRTRRMLEEYYVPHNERLAKLLRSPLPWVY